MNLENVKEILRYIRNANYVDVFGALMLNEQIDYMHEIDDIIQGDIDYLQKVYDYFMDNDYYTGLINAEEIIDGYEDAKDEESEEEE